MKILIIGATGVMGTNLVDILSKYQPNQIHATSRKSHKSCKPNLTYIQGNGKDLSFIIPLIKSENYDIIVDFMFYSTNEFKERINLFLDHSKQYIFVSSARIYADSATPITENSSILTEKIYNDKTFLNSNDYALTKLKEEEILKECSKKNWTIIRPYLTYSSIRLQLGIYEKESWLYRALKGRTILFSNDIANKKTTLTYGNDVAFIISKLINNPETIHESYNIVTEESIYWRDILDIYLQVLEKHTGRKIKVKYVDSLASYSNQMRNFQIKYDRTYSRTFDNSKLRQIVPSYTFKTIEEGITLALNDFLRKPHFKTINWKEEVIKDKITNEITPLNEIAGIKNKIKYLIWRFIYPTSKIIKRL